MRNHGNRGMQHEPEGGEREREREREEEPARGRGRRREGEGEGSEEGAVEEPARGQKSRPQSCGRHATSTVSRSCVGNVPKQSKSDSNRSEVTLRRGDAREVRLNLARPCTYDVLSPPARGLLEHDSALGCRMATMG